MRPSVAAALLLGSLIGTAAALTPQPAAPEGDGATLIELRQLRDVFLQRIAAEGYKPCAAPQIELGDPPSFGRYLSERNTLSIAAWSHLSPQERAGFEAMAQANGGEAAARAMFENGTHRWVFVHELGHWWQACRHLTREHTFIAENGANRMALAFWRERDARYASSIVRGYRSLLSSMPPPLPAGQAAPAYLDAHYASIASGDSYTWFQARMIAELADEQPPPSFHKSLSQPLYPY
jgi:hypothetical protein